MKANETPEFQQLAEGDSDDRDALTELLDKARSHGWIPRPTLWWMLALIPALEEKSEGGIIRPEEWREREQTAMQVGNILAMGPDCYKDKTKFSEPACKVGDWVVFKTYTGTRSTLFNKAVHMRFITDDMVIGVVDDPRGIITG